MFRLLRLLAVLLALAVGVDRLAAYGASVSVADRIQSAEHLSSRPGVDIQGFPFLTQVAAGSYQQVDITVHDFARGPVVLDSVSATLRTVQVPLSALVHHSGYRIRIARVSAHAVLGYAELDRLLADRGLTVTYAGSGQVRVTASALGLHASGIASPSLAGDLLTVTIDLPGPLGLRLSFREQLPALPFSLRYTGVGADAQGVTAGAAGGPIVLPA
jgi:hypothetical protein